MCAQTRSRPRRRRAPRRPVRSTVLHAVPWFARVSHGIRYDNKVKLRDIPRMLGVSATPREYPSTVATFMLPVDGEVRFAQWHHPNETLKVVSQDEVIDRKSTRLNLQSRLHLVCRLLLEKKK